MSLPLPDLPLYAPSRRGRHRWVTFRTQRRGRPGGRRVLAFRRVMVVANGKVPGMAVWRERLFAAMPLNANLPATYFGVPPAQVVEVGLEI